MTGRDEHDEEIQAQPAYPSFPIELFEEIACFVAGENDYGTLASMCATSKSMAQGLKGIMYETIVCNDQLLQRLRLGQADEERRDELRHVKFIITDKSIYGSKSPLTDTRFPNMRAVMVQELNPSSTFARDDTRPLHTIDLYIIRNTSLATISSVLRSPLEWAFRDRQASRSRALGIASVTFSKRAVLTVGEADRRGLFTPISSGIRGVLPRRALTEYGSSETRRLGTSIRTLLQLLPSASSPQITMPGRDELDIRCDDPEDLEVWLEELPSWFLQNPSLDPSFNLYFDHIVTRQEFEEYTQRFVDLYKKMWTSQVHAFQPLRDGNGDEADLRMLFQLFTFPPNDDRSERYVAHFVQYPGRSGFRVVIHESELSRAMPDGIQPVRMPRPELLEDRFIQLPGPRLLNSEDDSENDSEDDWEDYSEDD